MRGGKGFNRHWLPVVALAVTCLIGLQQLFTGYERIVQAQVFVAPRARVENVRFEQAGGGAVNVFYDLVSDDPKGTFTLSMEVSDDEGRTYSVKPRSVSGDVGPGVIPGTNKRIVWEAAKDVERLNIDRFRFRVTVDAGRASPAPNPGTPATARVGELVVTSNPAGATVTVDGRARGVTPLRLADVTVGEHRVVVSMAGYLENSQAVTVNESSSASLTLALTPSSPQAEPPKKGMNKLIYILPIAGGAAAAAALAGRGGGGGSDGGGGGTSIPTTTILANRAPTVSSFSVAPSFGISQLTNFSFSAAASDPDGDSVTYSWDVAGTARSGPSGSTTLTADGVREVRVTVTDGRGGSATQTGNITLGTMTGNWTFFVPGTGTLNMSLTQTGGTVTGTFVVAPGGFGNVAAGTSGRTDPAAPGSINANGAIEIRLKVGVFIDSIFRGTMQPTGRTVTGNMFNSGFTGNPGTMTKQ